MRHAAPVHAQVSGLTHKRAMRPFIEALGLPLPQLLGQADSLSDLDWAALPERLVIKPVNAANNEGVIVATDGCDQMTGVVFGTDLKSYATQLYEDFFAKPPPVLVEEMLCDVGAAEDPTLIIPRDFKVFTVAGHAAYVRVHDRNAPDGRRSIASFARDGTRLPPSLKGWPEAADDTALPFCFDQLIAMAEYLSQKLPWLLRLDFYLTPQGPVFGEFTTYPNAGLDLTPFSRRTMLQMWEIWPD